MEREKRNDKSFSRKRSFTFGAYGGVDRFTSGDETRPEPDHKILDILDSPTNESKRFLPASSNQRVTELFEIIEKIQGSRIEEQRCELPPPQKEDDHGAAQLLAMGGKLPLILPPKAGGYWVDPPLEKLLDVSPTSSPHSLGQQGYDIMERDSEAKIYQQLFCSRYHHTFTAVDSSLGPLVLSVCLEEEENRLRVILRMKECSLHGLFSVSLFPNIPSAVELTKMLCESVTVQRFEVVSYLKAPELITAFDEHRVSPNFKFGILYQMEGQLSEEDILSNNTESQGFREFLSIMGDTVQLQGFTGFKGGLDVCRGQTGSDAVFTTFHGREIMFHVATKLPFTEGDTQQLQRKRHIGNDIVALVYQEGQTPFLSDVISSNFLHCFLVVRRVCGGDQGATAEGPVSYQVSVTAREDVPPFGPALPDPPIFSDTSLLREFLLTKLINAEISCYKAERFSRLELRTRSSLLEGLQAELSARSQCMLGDASLPPEEVKGVSESSGGFIENFKRAIRVRSHSFDTLGVPKKIAGITTQKPKNAYTEKDGESDKSMGPTLPLIDNMGSTEGRGEEYTQEEL